MNGTIQKISSVYSGFRSLREALDKAASRAVDNPGKNYRVECNIQGIQGFVDVIHSVLHNRHVPYLPTRGGSHNNKDLFSLVFTPQRSDGLPVSF